MKEQNMCPHTSVVRYIKGNKERARIEWARLREKVNKRKNLAYNVETLPSKRNVGEIWKMLALRALMLSILLIYDTEICWNRVPSRQQAVFRFRSNNSLSAQRNQIWIIAIQINAYKINARRLISYSTNLKMILVGVIGKQWTFYTFIHERTYL